jgi:hypothetical protein
LTTAIDFCAQNFVDCPSDSISTKPHGSRWGHDALPALRARGR